MTCNVEPKEFLAGLNSLRHAKNVFCILLVLAVLLQIAAFVLVNWVGVIDAAPQAGLVTQGQPQEVQCSFGEPDVWYDVLTWVLPFIRFVGAVCCVLTVITMMFAALLSLISGQGGIKSFFSAFFWSLLLLAVLLPWQTIMKGSLVAGALFTLGELMRWSRECVEPWAQQGTGFWQQVPYYARFMAYPILVLFIWVVMQVKFARGFRTIAYNVAKSGQIEMETIPAPLSSLPLESDNDSEL
ncbi:MAG: hypothetical protein KAR11_04035 [Phycisphaerae bacterium]|nr:hypothetical protein [Phycisphaerae bacterium]